MDSSTRYYSSTEKHRILTQYRLRERGAGFASLAKNFSIQGGERTIRRWYAQWDGTPSSLKQQPRSGRPPILTQREIKSTNTLQHQSGEATENRRLYIILTFMQRYKRKLGRRCRLEQFKVMGRKTLQAKKKSTNKRTHSESKLTNI